MQAVHFTENPKYLYWKSKDQEKIAKFAGTFKCFARINTFLFHQGLQNHNFIISLINKEFNFMPEIVPLSQ